MEKFADRLDKMGREAKDIGSNIENNSDKRFWRKISKILLKTARYIKVWETSK